MTCAIQLVGQSDICGEGEVGVILDAFIGVMLALLTPSLLMAFLLALWLYWVRVKYLKYVFRPPSWFVELFECTVPNDESACLAWSTDGTRLLVESDSKRVVFDTVTWLVVDHNDAVFPPTADLVCDRKPVSLPQGGVIRFEKNRLEIADSDGKFVKSWSVSRRGNPSVLTVSADGAWVAVKTNLVLRVCETVTGRTVAKIYDPSDAFTFAGLAFSPASSRLASVGMVDGNDGLQMRLRVWELLPSQSQA